MSSTSDKKAKFFFANCLHCDGIIRIPIAIRPSSDVACPHCANRSKLVDLMDQIPEGEVVSGQGDPTGSAATVIELEPDLATPQKNGKFIVPSQLAAGIKKRRRRRRRSSESGDESGRSSSSSSSSSSSRSSDEQASRGSQSPLIRASTNNTSTPSAKPLSEAEENRQARKEEQAQRRREEFQKKRESTAARSGPAPARTRSKRPAPAKRNPVLETVKIVIGGMFAAPIAYLLLLWIFSRDPLGIAPTIHSVAPLLVPEWVLGDDEEAGRETPPAEKPFFEEEKEESDDFFKNLDRRPIDSGLGDGLGDSDGINFNETVFD